MYFFLPPYSLSLFYFMISSEASLGMGKSTLNWRTFCQFLGIPAYKSGWLIRVSDVELEKVIIINVI